MPAGNSHHLGDVGGRVVVIGVVQRPLQGLGQCGGYRGLAAAGHAHDHNQHSLSVPTLIIRSCRRGGFPMILRETVWLKE